MRHSGRAWQAADVANGTDEATAARRAEQTLAAYTGGGD
jgi:hypothetical protein